MLHKHILLLTKWCISVARNYYGIIIFENYRPFLLKSKFLLIPRIFNFSCTSRNFDYCFEFRSVIKKIKLNQLSEEIIFALSGGLGSCFYTMQEIQISNKIFPLGHCRTLSLKSISYLLCKTRRVFDLFSFNFDMRKPVNFSF